ncbi:MAG: tyrosine-type recombinase/integrase [Deltaproteobacteria bacterium]|nr:tyrosine-type recombinase/integrase [Deltaproteobacteria bacterium]
MNSIRYPKSGTNFRVTKRGYVDGIFIIDGKRVFKGLCKMADIEIGPNGKPRTPRQLNAVVQQLWDERRLAIEAEARKQELSDKMMGGLFEAWIQHAEAKRRSPETVRIHKLMRDYYLEMVGDHAIQELVGDPPKPGYDLRRADAYMEGMRRKGIGNARVNSYLGRLSSALRFGYNRGLLDRVPAIERLKVDKRPPKIPSAKQIGQVAKHLDDLVEKTKDRSIRYYYNLHRLLFYLLLGTGMRRGEAFHLRREHVDLENRSIHLIKTKTGDARVCRIPMFLKDRLDAHFQAHPGQEWVFEHPKTPGRQAWAAVLLPPRDKRSGVAAMTTAEGLS